MKKQFRKTCLIAFLTLCGSSLCLADVIVRGSCSNCSRSTNPDGTTVYSVTCTGTAGECVHTSDSGTTFGAGCNCAITPGSGLTQGVTLLSISGDLSRDQPLTRVTFMISSPQQGNSGF